MFDPSTGERLAAPPKPRGQSRRQFMQLMLAVAGGIGLSFLDWTASPFLRRAFADYYEYWSDCSPAGYFTSSQTCSPADAYFGSDNCDESLLAHFHRHQDLKAWTANGYDYKAYYEQEPSTCAGRNAWIWTARNTMCSDGHKTRWVKINGQFVEQYDNTSICRTAT